MHSGLQLQVLGFYKRCLVAAGKKPDPERVKQFVRDEFRLKPVKKSDFRHIEFLLRQGEKQLKMMSKSNATVFYKQ